MFDELLFAAAVVSGVSFARLVRRRDSTARGYLIAVGLVFAGVLVAVVEQSRFLGVVAVAMTGLIVVLPWLLEHGAREAFGRGRLRLAVGLAGVRALLMPGAGLSRQQEILRGLAVLERDGVDQALQHFRELVEDAEDGGELALINEQLVSMMFYGQRWDEGIALYEARFHPAYAAMRPALALGLLRAYGESNELERAAGLLRALEEGPLGHDPRAIGVLSQARLTFLAYAGATASVETALTERCREVLGLSAASSALFRGIAHLRAGNPAVARRQWEDVQRLAGSADDRVVDASRRAMAALEGYGETAAIDLEPDLQRYVEGVATRLDAFVRAAPRTSRRLPRFGAPMLVTGTVLGYLAFMGVGRGGYGLVELGAMVPALWTDGQWFRLASGAWTQADPVSTLLDVYVLWIAGTLFERVHGTGRLLLVALGGAAAGLLAAAGSSVGVVDVLAGGHLMSAAVLAGSIFTLLPVRSPRFPSRARRTLLLPMSFLFAAQASCMIPGLLPLPTPPVGFAVAIAVGVVVAMIPGRPGRALGWVGMAGLGIHLAGLVAAGVWAPTGTQRLAEHAHAVVLPESGPWTLPAAFVPASDPGRSGAAVPAVAGAAVDTIALRGGAVVQVLGDRSPGEGAGEPTPLIVERAPELLNALTVVPDVDLDEGVEAALVEAGVERASVRTFALRRNSEAVGIVVEVEHAGRRVGLVASPPAALSAAPRVYAAALAGQAAPHLGRP